MATITAIEFKAAIGRYISSHNLTTAALARELGKGESTVGDWRRTGIKTDAARQKIVEEFPQLFAQVGEVSATPAAPVRASEQDSARQNFLVLMKTEQARPAILNLTATLAWFLFKATAEERNEFRVMLGEDWTQFLELTRAMTNEAAFEITLKEGRLDWCK